MLLGVVWIYWAEVLIEKSNICWFAGLPLSVRLHNSVLTTLVDWCVINWLCCNLYVIYIFCLNKHRLWWRKCPGHQIQYTDHTRGKEMLFQSSCGLANRAWAWCMALPRRLWKVLLRCESRHFSEPSQNPRTCLPHSQHINRVARPHCLMSVEHTYMYDIYGICEWSYMSKVGTRPWWWLQTWPDATFTFECWRIRQRVCVHVRAKRANNVLR